MGAGMPGVGPMGGGGPAGALGGASAGIGAMPPGGPLESILGGGNNSYAHGYGMGTPGPFQPYQSGPGLEAPQGFNAQGGDLTQRGLGENMFALLGQNYTAPGRSEGFAGKTLGQYENGTPEGTTQQSSNYERFAGERPHIASEPGFDSYYDRAAERLSRDMGNQQAARGVYGSSVGLGQTGDALKDLRADQAKNEANYNLQRLGEERGWEGLQGQLAGSADQNSLANSANRLGWLQGLGGLANQGDVFGLNRINSGLSAGNNAQGLEQGRMQQLLNNEMGMGNAMSGLMGGAYGDMLGTDQDLMNSSMGMGLGQASEALNQDYRNQQKQKDDAQWGMDMATGVGGMMGGL